MKSKLGGGGYHEQGARVTKNAMQGKMHGLTGDLDFLLSYLYTSDNLVRAYILLEIIRTFEHTN